MLAGDVWRYLLVGTVVAIVAVTLGGAEVTNGRSVNLDLGAGIRAEWHNVNHALGIVNIVGNVVLLVPLGWLVAVRLLYSRAVPVPRAILRGFLAGLALSCFIEGFQYFLGRSADVDDVLLNTMGAALGAALGVALSAAR